MLRSLFSIWSPLSRAHRARAHRARAHRADLDVQATDEVVLYAHIDLPVVDQTSDSVGRQTAPPTTPTLNRPTPNRPTPNHRARVLSMRLPHLRLCSEKRCQRLQAVGIVTAGDLVEAEPLAMAKQMGVPAKAVSTLRRYQQSIKLSTSVPGLMPRDAMLLVEIHRRTVRALSLDSPVMLHRDLERYAMSSRGQRLLRGRRLPSLRRVKKWVEACSVAKVAPLSPLVSPE